MSKTFSETLRIGQSSEISHSMTRSGIDGDIFRPEREILPGKEARTAPEHILGGISRRMTVKCILSVE
ncbi:MAG: hypothetical protein PHD35_12045 [Synergistaceae bacterium]|nr:hypothetical protein [Synergistaceae bacterium]